MDAPPIIQRELRRLARRPLTYRIRSGAGLAAALISLGFMAVCVVQGSNPAFLGRHLFQALVVLAFGFSLLAGMMLFGNGSRCTCDPETVPVPGS